MVEPTPFENVSQIESFTQVGIKIKKYVKPQPRISIVISVSTSPISHISHITYHHQHSVQCFYTSVVWIKKKYIYIYHILCNVSLNNHPQNKCLFLNTMAIRVSSRKKKNNLPSGKLTNRHRKSENPQIFKVNTIKTRSSWWFQPI